MPDYTKHVWLPGHDATPDRLNNIEDGVDAANAAIDDDLIPDIAAAQSAAAAAQAAADQAQAAADAAQSDATGAIAAAATAQAAADAAQAAADALDTRVDGAEGTIVSLDGRLDTLEPQVADHETRLDAAEPVITSLDGRLDVVEPAVTALDGRLDAAEPTIADHETRLDAAEPQLVTLDSRLDAAEPQLVTLDSRLDAAEPAITALDGRLDVVEPAVAALDTRLDTAEADILAGDRLNNADFPVFGGGDGGKGALWNGSGWDKVDLATQAELNTVAADTAIALRTRKARPLAAGQVPIGVLEGFAPTIGSLSGNPPNHVFWQQGSAVLVDSGTYVTASGEYLAAQTPASIEVHPAAPSSGNARFDIAVLWFNPATEQLEVALCNGTQAATVTLAGRQGAKTDAAITTQLGTSGWLRLAEWVTRRDGSGAATIVAADFADKRAFTGQKKYGFWLFRSSSQTGIVSGAVTRVLWNAELIDVGDQHSLSVNTDILPLMQPGWYALTVVLLWDTNAAGVRYVQLGYTIDGSSGSVAADRKTVPSDGSGDHTMTAFHYFGGTTNATFVNCYHSSGANRSLVGAELKGVYLGQSL